MEWSPPYPGLPFTKPIPRKAEVLEVIGKILEKYQEILEEKFLESSRRIPLSW